MKKYITPLADVVVLNTKVKFMQVDGNPKGSFDVNPLNPEEPIVIGGDETDNANTYNVSLWDEE